LCIDLDAERRLALEQCAACDLEIVPVASGAAALTALASYDVAVLVTAMRGIDAEALLRTASERWPSTFRIVTSEQADIDRMLAWRDEGLASSYLVSPWRDTELAQLVRWGFEAWTLTKGDIHRKPSSTLVHDLKSPLMTILANADHLQTLAEIAPMLRALIESSALTPEERRPLHQLADDLQPMSEEIAIAVRRITHMLDQAHETSALPRRTRAK
jgi:response regulator RpfG family c-di-GMP phosphodiesterase